MRKLRGHCTARLEDGPTSRRDPRTRYILVQSVRDAPCSYWTPAPKREPRPTK